MIIVPRGTMREDRARWDVMGMDGDEWGEMGLDRAE